MIELILGGAVVWWLASAGDRAVKRGVRKGVKAVKKLCPHAYETTYDDGTTSRGECLICGKQVETVT